MFVEKLSIEEQEVSINFNRASDVATLYTSDITWIRSMDKKCEENPDTYKCIEIGKMPDGTIVSKTYSFPKKLVSTRKPMAQKNVSEDVKKIRMENLAKARKTKEKNGGEE